MGILILDGVTGAGKTSAITELHARSPGEIETILEDDTLGDLMDQVRDPAWRTAPRFESLEAVLSRIEKPLVA